MYERSRRDLSHAEGVTSLTSAGVVCRPRHPGNTFVSFSMSNLELAALAHLSNDEALLQCLSAQDPVAQVASVLLQVHASWHNSITQALVSEKAGSVAHTRHKGHVQGCKKALHGLDL